MSYLEANVTPGDTITVTIIRDNIQKDVELVVGARPSIN
jgi:hypothetical protein